MSFPKIWFGIIAIGLLIITSGSADTTDSSTGMNNSSSFQHPAHPQGGYWMTVDNLPIGTHYVGDSFTVSGETNLPAGQEIEFGAYISRFNTGALGNMIPYGSGSTYVTEGSGGINTWSFKIDTTRFIKQTRTAYFQSEAVAGDYLFTTGQYESGRYPFTLVNKTQPPMESSTRITLPGPTFRQTTQPTTVPAPVSMMLPIIATGIVVATGISRKR